MKIEVLHHQLVEERRRVVEIAAESSVLPPANLLAYLADLDDASRQPGTPRRQRAERGWSR